MRTSLLYADAVLVEMARLQREQQQQHLPPPRPVGSISTGSGATPRGGLGGGWRLSQGRQLPDATQKSARKRDNTTQSAEERRRTINRIRSTRLPVVNIPTVERVLQQRNGDNCCHTMPLPPAVVPAQPQSNVSVEASQTLPRQQHHQPLQPQLHVQQPFNFLDEIDAVHRDVYQGGRYQSGLNQDTLMRIGPTPNSCRLEHLHLPALPRACQYGT